MKKRTIALLMAGTMAVCSLAGCGGSTGTDNKNAEATTAAVETATEAADTDTAAKEAATVAAGAEGTTFAEGADSDWYMQALADPAMTSKYSYYRFIDVNKDGVPVLIMSTTDKAFVGAEDKACLMVYYKGEPKTVKELGGAGGESFYYDDDHKLLTYFSRLSGETHLEICELKDGKLEVVKTVDYYAPHHSPDVDNEDPIYKIDGADVSEKEFYEIYDDYAEDDDAVTYESIK